MNIVTGCSGIDAIAYAALLLDIDIIGQIEIDSFCNTILELRYPGVKRYKDIFDVRGDEFGAVDIFGFGDPCQPHSVAGKQKGTADERYIWPEIFRVIETMRPTWIINENVTGSVSNGVVLSKINDLESEGYRAKAFIIPACSIGAPHKRERVFIVANSRCSSGQGQLFSGSNAIKTKQENAIEIKRPGEICIMADTNREHCQNCNITASRGKQRIINGSIKETGANRPTQSGMGGNADGLPSRLYRPGGQEDSSGILEAFEEIFTATLKQIPWPAGYGAEQYDYEPPRVASGVKNRTNRLKALGNAIVWQQIFPILLAIKLIERWSNEDRRSKENSFGNKGDACRK